MALGTHAAVGETPPFRAVVGEVGIRESDATLEFLAIAPASRAGQRRALCPEALDERDPHVAPESTLFKTPRCVPAYRTAGALGSRESAVTKRSEFNIAHELPASRDL